MDLKLTITIFGMLAAGNWAISCYKCDDCTTQEAVTTDCSSEGTSDSCYAVRNELTDTVKKSCETADLDRYNVKTGCIKIPGTKVCRCKTDYCNTDALISGSPATSVRSSLILLMLAAIGFF
ncbi:uncharacterized protein [Watersipora subatra]|uniref:uncharacterized protein n=1 Tax=Watersipora subatra TaxID=2589382 RepID=UPI00355B675C